MKALPQPKPVWFLNRYHCEACGESWEDEWDCTCNDRCPICNTETEPEHSEEIDAPGMNEKHYHTLYP